METNEKHSSEHDHIVSYNTYVLVWLALVGFTLVTVAISGFNFGGATVLVALAIAIIKSALVLNIFMHIRFDDMVFKVFITVGVVTLASAILGTYFDYIFR